MELFLEAPVIFDERPPDLYRRARRELAFGYPKQLRVPGVDAPAPTSLIVKVGSEGLQRYQSFGAEGDLNLAQRFRARMMAHPHTTRIDVGAIYALPPKTAQKYAAGVEFRELVFDVDIFPDYNAFRMCKCIENLKGEPPYVCVSCWPYLCAAMHALDFILQTRFGFHECMWLFSGRRGVHCWVLDPAAGLLTEAARRGIANQLRAMNKLQGTLPSIWAEHQDDFQRLYLEILRPRFDAMMAAGQINLSNPDTVGIIAGILNKVANQDVFKLTQAQLKDNPVRSPIAWAAFEKLAQEIGMSMIDLVFYVLFPKIDFNVVPSPAHLLRCPMSVHTGSFGVVVPLMLSEVDSINPASLPNLQNSYSMDTLQRYRNRFEQYLWSRHSLASELVCLECASKLSGLINITRDMLFEYDVGAWKAHYAEQHPRARLPPIQSATLRELVHLRTARAGSNLTDWSRKYSLFTQLKERL